VTTAIEDASIATNADTDRDDADETEPPIESVETAAVDDDADDVSGIPDRRPPSAMSPAEEPTTTPTDTEPIPDAESDAADDDGSADTDDDTTDHNDGE